MNVRSAFETWYAENAFDLLASPIGSRDCALQWAAWQAGAAALFQHEIQMTEPENWQARLLAVVRKLDDAIERGERQSAARAIESVNRELNEIAEAI